MKRSLEYDINQAHHIASITSALNIADTAISNLLDSITPLVKGQLAHFLLYPLQSRTLISKTQDMADRFNLEVVVNQPIDILKCAVTSFATSTTWYALISVPLVHRSETLEAFQFINIPWFHKGISVQWDIPTPNTNSISSFYWSVC